MKKSEARQKTTAALIKIAREHFTRYGYYDVSLEKIAEEGKVTRGAVYHHFKNKQGLFMAVVEAVQTDIARIIELEAQKSDDSWQQLIAGCRGFVKGANANDCRRILLVDAPAVVGWQAWRKVDRENSMGVLREHIEELKAQGYLAENVDPGLMTYAVSGALNELALNYPLDGGADQDHMLSITIAHIVGGFKRDITD